MKGNISTRAGDKGQTHVGGGGRVSKDDARIECLGDLDEATSFIGLLRTKLPADHDWDAGLQRIQTELMNLMAHVATPSSAPRRPQVPLPTDSSLWMEQWMQEIEERLPEATEYFILPGGSEVAALCHVARTTARRAERRLVTLDAIDPVDPSILPFLNRLSDLFFKLSREELHRRGIVEERWRLFRRPRPSGARQDGA